MGIWDQVPQILGFLKEANSSDLAHWQSLRKLMDDAFKMVYAYDLCPSPKSADNSSLLRFESMATVETDTSLMYLTPTSRLVLGDLEQAAGWLHGDSFHPNALQRPLVSKLAGVPSEWSACFAVSAKEATLWHPMELRRQTQDQRTAMLMTAYARVIMDLFTFFTQGCRLPINR